ncbi:thioredoxin reductase (NADPH) [Ruminococcaceae bacterium FB2012]|nr:thioredoxin reductase (NADPH) [Ruminococcaceae bacterium FB2012]
MYDIIIIGAGPAGMTAAIYARRAEKSVLVLEARSYGGQIVSTPEIENYPAAPHISGFDFATKVYEQAVELGAEFRFERVTGITDGSVKTVTTSGGSYEGRAVIIATGSECRRLGLPGEDKLAGRGISYCATCDGGFFRKKDVAVVGGGNTALEDALYLSGLARTVYVIHRRDSFRGDGATAARLRSKDNVKLVLNSRVTALEYGDRLTGIEVTDNDGGVSSIPLDGLFIAVGRTPENAPFAGLIELDGAGYVSASENCRTSVPGIFAAGDNRTKEVRQLVTAAADGAVAAGEAIKYLEGSGF